MGRYYYDLPPSLGDAKQNEVIKKMNEGNVEARDELITGNLRLAMYCANKFDNVSEIISLDDRFSVAIVGLIKAVDTFDLKKNIKFATYASKCIENELLMALRTARKYTKHETSLEQPLSVDIDGNQLTLIDVLCHSDDESLLDVIIFETDRKRFWEVIGSLGAREKFLLEQTIKEGKTQKEIAGMLNLSQSYISRLVRIALDKLRMKVG